MNYKTEGVFYAEHQLWLPHGETFNPKKFAKFDVWRRANPDIIDWVLGNLDKLKRDKRGYCSSANLTAGIRDHYPGQRVQTDPDYGLNDHIIPYLKRHLIFRRP